MTLKFAMAAALAIQASSVAHSTPQVPPGPVELVIPGIPVQAFPTIDAALAQAQAINLQGEVLILLDGTGPASDPYGGFTLDVDQFNLIDSITVRPKTPSSAGSSASRTSRCPASPPGRPGRTPVRPSTRL